MISEHRVIFGRPVGLQPRKTRELRDLMGHPSSVICAHAVAPATSGARGSRLLASTASSGFAGTLAGTLVRWCPLEYHIVRSCP